MDKIRKINRLRVFIISFLFFSFLGIVCFFYLQKQFSGNRVVLFFLNQEKTGLVKEMRRLDFSGVKTVNIFKTLKELTYGPLTYEFESVLSSDSKILNIWLRDNTLYVNINKESFAIRDKKHYAIYSLNKTVFKNFPFIKKVKYLIDGENVPTITGTNNFGIFYVRGQEKK